MSFEVIKSEGVPISHLPFSPATKAGGFVFVSGQASVDETGKIIPGTFEEEFRRSIENVKAILAADGLTLKDVVRVCSYVRRPEDVAEYNELYREYFKAPLPARTTITKCLPEIILYEVDVIAYAGK